MITSVDKHPKDVKVIIFLLFCFFEGLLSSCVTAPHNSMDTKAIILIDIFGTPFHEIS